MRGLIRRRTLRRICVLAAGAVLLAGCTATAVSPTPSPVPGGHMLEEFEFLELGMSFEEIVARVGEPARDDGSGVYAYVYPLQDGRELVLTFLQLDSLAGVSVYDPRDGTRETLLGSGS